MPFPIPDVWQFIGGRDRVRSGEIIRAGEIGEPDQHFTAAVENDRFVRATRLRALFSIGAPGYTVDNNFPLAVFECVPIRSSPFTSPRLFIAYDLADSGAGDPELILTIDDGLGGVASFTITAPPTTDVIVWTPGAVWQPDTCYTLTVELDKTAPANGTASVIRLLILEDELTEPELPGI